MFKQTLWWDRNLELSYIGRTDGWTKDGSVKRWWRWRYFSFYSFYYLWVCLVFRFILLRFFWSFYISSSVYLKPLVKSGQVVEFEDLFKGWVSQHDTDWQIFEPFETTLFIGFDDVKQIKFGMLLVCEGSSCFGFLLDQIRISIEKRFFNGIFSIFFKDCICKA